MNNKTNSKGKVFIEKELTDEVEGEYDEDGFFVTPNGSFWDPDGVYFNRDGFDRHGGHYDENTQEYIPGDDSHLFDAVVYCDKNRKTKLVSFAQIGLQEHSKNMVGNAAVLINGYNLTK